MSHWAFVKVKRFLVGVMGLLLFVFPRFLVAGPEAPPLDTQEKALESLWNDTVRMEAFVDDLARRLDPLKAQLEAAVGAKLRGSSDELTAHLSELGSVTPVLESGKASILEFQRLYDAISVGSAKAVADHYRVVAEKMVQQAMGRVSVSKKEKLEQLHREFVTSYERFRSVLDDRSEGLSFGAVKAGRAYFSTLEKLLELSASAQRGKAHRLIRYTAKVWRKLISLALLSPLALALPKVIWNAARNRPLAEPLANPAKSYLRKAGFHWSVSHPENLHPGEKEIRVFLVNHASPLDYLVQVGLEGKPMHVSYYGFLPGFAQRWLAGRPQLIGVGGGRRSPDPRDQVKSNIRHGIRTAYLYPEANTGLALGRDTRPAGPAFLKRMLPILRANAPVSVVPITNPDHYRVMDDLDSGGDIVTQAHRPIPSAVVDYLWVAGEEDLLMRLARQRWIAAISRRFGSQENPTGRVPTTRVIDDLGAYFTRHAGCDLKSLVD